MIKLIRAAAGPLQTAFDTLARRGEESIGAGIKLSYHPTRVEVRADGIKTAGEPPLEPYEVLTPFLDAFRADGWGYNALYDGPVTDRDAKIVGYSLNHPMTLTRTGDEAVKRPALLRLEIPLPDRRVNLDSATVSRYGHDVRELVIDILTQQKVREDDERSQRQPVPLWARKPSGSLSDDQDAPAPPAAHTEGLELRDEDDEANA